MCRYPYAAVAELVYGKRMRCVVTFLLNLTVFGAGIPNILVCEYNLRHRRMPEMKIIFSSSITEHAVDWIPD